MAKIDYKKVYKNLFTGKKDQPVLIDVPEFNYLMVDGKGNPNTSKEFQDAIEVLYGVSYTMKFMVKGKDPDKDYTVMPMEALWWVEDMTKFDTNKKDDWLWTIMIMQPDFVTENNVREAIEAIKKKKDLTALAKLRFEKFPAQKAGQIMHIGPYDKEEPTIKILHNFIKDSGFELTGKHQEIYLSDPRRTDPEKLKTIIRQPYK